MAGIETIMGSLVWCRDGSRDVVGAVKDIWVICGMVSVLALSRGAEFWAFAFARKRELHFLNEYVSGFCVSWRKCIRQITIGFEF